ncbi:MAG: hypothetical protein AAB019_04710 [Planctomycetota bacterium]
MHGWPEPVEVAAQQLPVAQLEIKLKTRLAPTQLLGLRYKVETVAVLMPAEQGLQQAEQAEHTAAEQVETQEVLTVEPVVAVLVFLS